MEWVKEDKKDLFFTNMLVKKMLGKVLEVF